MWVVPFYWIPICQQACPLINPGELCMIGVRSCVFGRARKIALDFPGIDNPCTGLIWRLRSSTGIHLTTKDVHQTRQICILARSCPVDSTCSFECISKRTERNLHWRNSLPGCPDFPTSYVFGEAISCAARRKRDLAPAFRAAVFLLSIRLKNKDL